MSNRIVGCDIGYGDVKVVVGTVDTGEITHIFKFSSAIAKASKVSVIRDARIMDLVLTDGSKVGVYVGADALNLPSSDIVDITSYEALENYAPVFVKKALDIAEIPPEEVKCLVAGLSVSQLSQSGYFKERIQKFTIGTQQYHFDEVFLLPQGAGSKLTFDKYGLEYPKTRTEKAASTFVGCDIGFNTLDMFYVTDGKTSPNLFEGLEGEGVMRIASMVRDEVKARYERELSLREAKEVLDTKVYKLRGQRYDMKEVVDAAVKAYKDRLLKLIEEKYGAIIDKCDFVVLKGGGAALCASIEAEDPFFRVVKSHSEFYNAIGFYLYGCNKLQNS